MTTKALQVETIWNAIRQITNNMGIRSEDGNKIEHALIYDETGTVVVGEIIRVWRAEQPALGKECTALRLNRWEVRK